MKRGSALLALAAAIVALGLVPVLAPPFYANLLIPFYGYAIALLGFNLLFGYTGLLSFGHAMFLGLGAYTAAVIAGVWGIRQFEIALLGAAVAGFAVSLPLGWLAVRYTGIFFGMLTLAFGMLAHSFLFKFYHLTAATAACASPACGC
jgi:branched-chain amino acid transport system permease protein